MTTPPLIKPVAIGPTWQRDPKTGAFLLPERTLGWDVLGWTAEYLRQPDGPDAGTPWRYTDEQARFILWWFAIDDTGRFVYRNGMLRRVKGWGSTRQRPRRRHDLRGRARRAVTVRRLRRSRSARRDRAPGRVGADRSRCARPDPEHDDAVPRALLRRRALRLPD